MKFVLYICILVFCHKAYSLGIMQNSKRQNQINVEETLASGEGTGNGNFVVNSKGTYYWLDASGNLKRKKKKQLVENFYPNYTNIYCWNGTAFDVAPTIPLPCGMNGVQVKYQAGLYGKRKLLIDSSDTIRIIALSPNSSEFEFFVFNEYNSNYITDVFYKTINSFPIKGNPFLAATDAENKIFNTLFYPTEATGTTIYDGTTPANANSSKNNVVGVDYEIDSSKFFTSQIYILFSAKNEYKYQNNSSDNWTSYRYYSRRMAVRLNNSCFNITSTACNFQSSTTNGTYYFLWYSWWNSIGSPSASPDSDKYGSFIQNFKYWINTGSDNLILYTNSNFKSGNPNPDTALTSYDFSSTTNLSDCLVNSSSCKLKSIIDGQSYSVTNRYSPTLSGTFNNFFFIDQIGGKSLIRKMLISAPTATFTGSTDTNTINFYSNQGLSLRDKYSVRTIIGSPLSVASTETLGKTYLNELNSNVHLPGANALYIKNGIMYIKSQYKIYSFKLIKNY